MLIRVGYEFIFDVPAPAPMLLLLDLGSRPRLERCAGRAG